MPAAAIIFYATLRLKREMAAYVLLLSSAVFYGFGDPKYLLLLYGSIVFNYFLGRQIYRNAVRGNSTALLFFSGVALNLMMLSGFKFGLFHVQRDLFLPGVTALVSAGVIPLGMSFYTLQQITFLAEMKKGESPPENLLGYSLYTSFFAQIVAGPIVRYSEGIRTFASVNKHRINWEMIARGVSLLIFGLAKKSLIADQLDSIVSPIFDHAAATAAVPDIGDSWLASWGYLLQLYFDFSSYSDMAVGIGLIFGIPLPVNFNSPLKAVSPSDCFTRWHITFTEFIRIYAFAPLFNLLRRMPWFLSNRYFAWGFSVIVSMTLVGVWHGSGSTFILSGFLIGVVSVCPQFWQLIMRKKAEIGRHAPGLRGRIGVLAALTVFGVFFRAPDMNTALSILRGMVTISSLSLPRYLAHPLQALFNSPDFVRANGLFPLLDQSGKSIVPLIVIYSVIALTMPNTNRIFMLAGQGPEEQRRRHGMLIWKPTKLWAFFTALLMAVSTLLIISGGLTPNIYGQF